MDGATITFVFFFSVSFMIENIFPIANKYSFVPKKVTLEVEPAKLARPTTLECLFSESVIRQKLNRLKPSNLKVFF